MILSRGAYTRTPQAIQSSNGTAAYTSDTTNLVDCIPSSRCALTWPSGSQSAAVYVHLTWRMTPAPTSECRVFALLGLAGIQAGMAVELYGGATSNPSTLLSGTETVQFPDGTVGAWVVRDAGAGWTHEYFAWRIYNDDGSGAPIAASATVYVGELYASPAWDWPVGRWETRVVMPQLLNRSSSGAARKRKRPPYRQVDLTITPQDWAATMLDDGSLLSMLYDLASQDCVAIVPRPEHRGAGGVDDALLPRNAMLADLTEAGGLGADAAVDRYPLTLGFEEFL